MGENALADRLRPADYYRKPIGIGRLFTNIMSDSSSTDSATKNHRHTEPASVQSGYRFVTNIAAADVARALKAARMAAPCGEIHLVLIASSDLGLPLKGAALYVRDQVARLEFFWHLFRSLAPKPTG